ncbi:MAG: type 2 isopentenyl-diphosphate Delta-isomerase [Candidatus Micrarchaeota archaeon]
MASIEKRKAEHVSIALKKNVAFRDKTSGFDDVDFLYYCLPEMNFDEVDTRTTFLGRKLNAPLLVSSMTGGFKEAEKINCDLACACEEKNIMLGLGSIRPMLQHSDLAKSFCVKKKAPKVFLAGNIGATQLHDYSVGSIRNALEQIEADCLFVHINALQDVIQPDGDKKWKGVLARIEGLCGKLDLPVIAKEVGAGINGEIARELQYAGVSAIDVAGAGGTSWAAMELYRNGAKEGELYWDFGIPTAIALKQCAANTSLPLIASGGIRSGLDVAKAIRLGASLAGAAVPFLKAQQSKGAAGVAVELDSWVNALKIAMFCTRSKNLAQLRKAKLLSG